MKDFLYMVYLKPLETFLSLFFFLCPDFKFIFVPKFIYFDSFHKSLVLMSASGPVRLQTASTQINSLLKLSVRILVSLVHRLHVSHVY